ncbi:MAG: PilX N-terminal domain-containing pilus assembly protein [Methylococcales bacterium]
MVRGAFQAWPSTKPPKGFATLLVILLLLVGMTTITLTVSRSGILEQQLSGNDNRAQEVQKASEAALEYVLAWATVNPIPGTGTVNCGASPVTGCPTLPNNLAGTDGGQFVLSVEFSHDPDPNYIKITASATQSDNDSSASTSCYVKRDPITSKVTIIPGTWKDF